MTVVQYLAYNLLIGRAHRHVIEMEKLLALLSRRITSEAHLGSLYCVRIAVPRISHVALLMLLVMIGYGSPPSHMLIAQSLQEASRGATSLA